MMWQQRWCYMPEQMNGKKIFLLFWNARLIPHPAGTTHISSFPPTPLLFFIYCPDFTDCDCFCSPFSGQGFWEKKTNQTNTVWVFSCTDIISCPSLSQWMCQCCHKAYAVSGVFFPPLLFKHSRSSLFSVMRSWRKPSQRWHRHRHPVHPYPVRREQTGSDKAQTVGNWALAILIWCLGPSHVQSIVDFGFIRWLSLPRLLPMVFPMKCSGTLPVPCQSPARFPPQTGEAERHGEVVGKESRTPDTRLGAPRPPPSPHAATLPAPYFGRVYLILPWIHLLFES